MGSSLEAEAGLRCAGRELLEARQPPPPRPRPLASGWRCRTRSRGLRGEAAGSWGPPLPEGVWAPLAPLVTALAKLTACVRAGKGVRENFLELRAHFWILQETLLPPFAPSF